VAGQDTLFRGSSWIATNKWSFSDLGNSQYRLQVITKWKTTKAATRTDTLEMGIPCLT